MLQTVTIEEEISGKKIRSEKCKWIVKAFIFFFFQNKKSSECMYQMGESVDEGCKTFLVTLQRLPFLFNYSARR
jgi:hypothetical protein